MASDEPDETWSRLLESTQQCETLFEEIQRDIIKPDRFKYILALASLHLPGNNETMSIPKILQRRLDQLRSREIRILVAGDISAGKSTLMNILMGGKYLPVKSRATTKVFCELEDSSDNFDRSAVLQFEPTECEVPRDARHQDDDQTTVLKVVDDRKDNALNDSGTSLSFIETMNVVGSRVRSATEEDAVDETGAVRGEGVDDLDQTSVKESTFSIAGDEIRDVTKTVFIDTPGITSKADEEHEVFDEVDEAGSMYQAFIMVIKDHSQIRREGLQMLMKDIEKSIKQQTDLMNPDCALFIVNKFDQVDEEERDEIKQILKSNLLDIWPCINKDHIIFMSASRKEMYENDGTVSHTGFANRIRAFVTNTLRVTVEEHCLWLLSLLEVLHAIAKAGKQWPAMKYTQQQLDDNLRKLLSDAITLSEGINVRSDGELDQLYRTTSRELLQHLNVDLNWDQTEIDRKIPNADMDWKDLIDTVDDMIFEKLSEQSKARIDALKVKFEMQWEKKYKNEIRQLKSVQDYIEGMNLTDNDQLSVKEGIATAMVPVALSGIIRAAPLGAPFLFLAFPLLPIPLVLKSFVDQYKDYKNEQLRDEFRRNKVTFFEKRARELRAVFQSSLERQYIQDLRRAPLFVNFFGAFPKLVLSQQIEEVQNTVQTLRSLSSQPMPVGSEIFDKLLAKTMEVYTNGILIHEIDPERLHWCTDDEDNRVDLGKNVFKATMDLIGYDGAVEVAVKELKFKKNTDSQHIDSIHSDLDIYRECFILRQLSRTPNGSLIKFFGSSFRPENVETGTICKLRLVFELCSGTLDDVIDRRAPNDDERSADFKWYAAETIRGLKFLHDRNIVHRDMKPSNCLLKDSDDGSVRRHVKLADVGAAKQKDLICTAAQIRGTPAYWAPEIVEHTSIRYHSKASDIYSLGLILWELWYRQRAYMEYSIVTGKIPDRFPDRSRPEFEIIRLCLRRHPFHRVSITVLEQQPCLQQQAAANVPRRRRVNVDHRMKLLKETEM